MRGRPPLPEEHGTARGYRQHISRRTGPACRPCVDAKLAEGRAYRAAHLARIAARLADPAVLTRAEGRAAGYHRGCLHCGHAFLSQRPDTRFCGRPCRQAAAYRRRKAGTQQA